MRIRYIDLDKGIKVNLSLFSWISHVVSCSSCVCLFSSCIPMLTHERSTSPSPRPRPHPISSPPPVSFPPPLGFPCAPLPFKVQIYRLAIMPIPSFYISLLSIILTTANALIPPYPLSNSSSSSQQPPYPLGNGTSGGGFPSSSSFASAPSSYALAPSSISVSALITRAPSVTIGSALSFAAPMATPLGVTSLYPDADGGVGGDTSQAAEEDGGEEEDDGEEEEEEDDGQGEGEGEGEGEGASTSTITRTVIPVEETIPTMYSTRTTEVSSASSSYNAKQTTAIRTPPPGTEGGSGRGCIPHTIQCITSRAYALCMRTSRTQSAFVFLGGVPRGTTCRGGQILGVVAGGRDPGYPGYSGGYGNGDEYGNGDGDGIGDGEAGGVEVGGNGRDGGCTPPGSVVCGERGSMFRLCAPVGWVEVRRLPGGVVCLENELWGRGG